ncbi:DUF2284 domain-containing protein [Thermodesulfobacteriota bacterium]
MDRKIEKITLERSEDQMQQALEKYKEKALELGATKAAILDVNDIVVEERVTLKCQIPRCFGYGTSAHCPPNTLKPNELREILKEYRRAVFFIKDVPSEVIVRDRATITERIRAYQDVFDIVNKVESIAFYDGNYTAFGFAAGSCLSTLCSQEKSCRALDGERCRFSLKARPSMEAVGMDVYKMVASQGWEIYPIGSDAKPEDIPKGTLAGIVIVN